MSRRRPPPPLGFPTSSVVRRRPPPPPQPRSSSSFTSRPPLPPKYSNPPICTEKPNVKEKIETPSPPGFFFFCHGKIHLPSLFSPSPSPSKPSSPSPPSPSSSSPISSCSSFSSPQESPSLSSSAVVVCKSEEHQEAIKQHINNSKGKELPFLSTETAEMAAKTIKYSDTVSIHMSNPPSSFSSGVSPYAIHEAKAHVIEYMRKYHDGFQDIMDGAKQTMYFQIQYLPVDKPTTLPVPEVREDFGGNGPSDPVIVSKLHKNPRNRSFSPSAVVTSAVEWEDGGGERGQGFGGGREVDRVKGTLVLSAVLESMKRADSVKCELFTSDFYSDLELSVCESIDAHQKMSEMSEDIATGLRKVDGHVVYW